MADFLTAYAPLARYEGGWCNDPADRGGETYAGIARNFFPAWPGWAVIDAARAHPSFQQGAAAFSRHLAALPDLSNAVRDWYRTEWWDRLGLGSLPQALANEIFEQAVNLGKGGAGRLLQRVINAFNWDKAHKRPLFPDLVVDGAIGPRTLDGLALLLRARTNEAALVHALNCMQGAHYINIAAGKSSQRRFTDGWLTRTHTAEPLGE
ncbi:MAG TPA: surface-binding protein [Candidatus Desulfovibrio gallistercoris]|nr:surface-binding protein [Candidatus Desulfovibrio gallistercoris]